MIKEMFVICEFLFEFLFFGCFFFVSCGELILFEEFDLLFLEELIVGVFF